LNGSLCRAACAVAAALAFAGTFLSDPRAAAPESTLPATIQPLEGGALELNGAQGATELLFVARWCSPCEREIAAARRRQAELQRIGYRVVLVGVSQRQSAEQFATWARGVGWEGALVHDQDGSLERACGAKLLPWHSVIGKGGKLLHSGDVAPEGRAVREWLGS
jgi:peroxiredoxin